MDDPVILPSERNFTTPNVPAHFTGTLWKNKDGSLAATITDIFNVPIHLTFVKEGDTYFVRGWRGKQPQWLAVPLVDDEMKEPDATE